MGDYGIGKVVFPVAGLGTRFLPATKAVPKELLTLVDRPLIQYAIDEAVAAGAHTLIFVTGHFQDNLKRYLEPARDLEDVLRAGNKSALLEQLQRILPSNVDCVFVEQLEPRGLGDAIFRAREAVGAEPFGVILPDDLIQAGPPGTLARMARANAGRKGAMIAVETVPEALTHRYGVIAPGKTEEDVIQVHGLVEKPAPDRAPSNLGIVGRYILPPQVFDRLENAKPGAGGEVQVTDAIAALLPEYPVSAYRFPGKRFDCGSKSGYIEATVAYALEHPELKDEFAVFLKSLDLL